MDSLHQQLKLYGKVKVNEPLSKHTTFRIGGPARYFVIIEDADKLVGLLNFISGEGVSYFILGGGSNVLMSDDGLDGVVIKLENSKIEHHENKINCEAGALLGSAVDLAAANKLTGLEWAAGIPGTVGGAVRGNAGAMGKNTGNSIESVTVWADGEIRKIANGECGFRYRDSVFKHSDNVILSAAYRLSAGDFKDIAKKINEFTQLRSGKHPRLPSAGSLFKNISIEDWKHDKKILPEQFVERGTVPVGWLIEQVDARGFVYGGAKVSDEHGNFIVNFNNATQADVLKIVDEVKNRVYTKFKIELELEVEIIK